MAKQPQACGCGCGGMTKGGRFLPGHDARFHAAQKAGNLGKAIAHATGAHRKADDAPLPSPGYQRPTGDEKPGDAVPVGEGVPLEKGTPIAAGMYVRAINDGGKASEGIVYHVSPFGWVAYMDETGGQHIGKTATFILDDNTKRRPNPHQRARLQAIGREVPGMTGGKQ